MSSEQRPLAPPMVCTPLWAERAAMAGALPGIDVRRTGAGLRRSANWAEQPQHQSRAVLVAGVAGALHTAIRPGDLVVATEVTGGPESFAIPSVPILAGALRRAGITTHTGTLHSSPTIVSGAARSRLAAGGAVAVDMESAALANAARGGPFAVIRAVVDTPDHPLLSVGTPARGVRALRSLRAAAPVVQDWIAAAGPREIRLASPRSFCAGVDRAIETVQRCLVKYGAPVYVRRQIVHNSTVVAQLEQRGAIFVEELEQVPEGSVVVLAAHGVAPAVRHEAARRGLSVVDATCPLVSKVHNEVRRYSAQGDTVFLIGHHEHEEVVGTVGEAPDNVVVVDDMEAAERVAAPDPSRVAYVMQTTLAVDEASDIAGVLRRRFPALSAPRRDDICYATTNRQRSVREVAAQSDLVLVLGSANSSNSRRLVEVSERSGCPAYLVEDAGEVQLPWLASARRIGITAGASAPPHLVSDLVHALSGLGPVTVTEHAVTAENVEFTLPREVV